MVDAAQDLVKVRKPEESTGPYASDHTGQGQLPRLRLLRRCAPRNDMRGEGTMTQPCWPRAGGPRSRLCKTKPILQTAGCILTAGRKRSYGDTVRDLPLEKQSQFSAWLSLAGTTAAFLRPQPSTRSSKPSPSPADLRRPPGCAERGDILIPVPPIGRPGTCHRRPSLRSGKGTVQDMVQSRAGGWGTGKGVARGRGGWYFVTFVLRRGRAMSIPLTGKWNESSGVVET
jgi:hypothetical protein